MLVPPKSKPPSIPVRKLPTYSYTGKNGDIPGPANYNPDDKMTKTQKRITDFSKTENSREIFHDPNTKNPGPGGYDHTNLFDEEKEQVPTAKSSMFKSKVPNCSNVKDNGVPGPGSYIDKKTLHSRSNSYRIEPNGRGFMSSTKREGFWDNNIETPFTKGTNKTEEMGPGKYQKKKKKNRPSGSAAIKHAFDSSEIRDCMKKGSKIHSPGPGHYIDLSSGHFIGNKTIGFPFEQGRAKSPKGRTNHFSTKSTRFTGGFFKTKEGPGPGQYIKEANSIDPEEKGILTRAQKRIKGKEGAVFRSTTNRFNYSDSDSRNPLSNIEGSNSKYNDLAIYNLRAGNFNSQPQGLLYKNQKVGFTATSPRFTHNQVFYGQKLKYTPGPGDYHSQGRRPQSFSHNRGVGRKQGFGSYFPNKGTNNSVGPGSYISTECTMIKKSYNMRI
jgi:hypothetical protein